MMLSNAPRKCSFSKRNSGSGVRLKGFSFKPKYFSYMDSPARLVSRWIWDSAILRTMEPGRSSSLQLYLPHGPAQAGNAGGALPTRRPPLAGRLVFGCACSGASRSEERNRGHGHEKSEARIVHQREAV